MEKRKMRRLLEALHSGARGGNVLAGLKTAMLLAMGTVLGVTAMMAWQADRNDRYIATSPPLRKRARTRVSRVVSPHRAKMVTATGAWPQSGKPAGARRRAAPEARARLVEEHLPLVHRLCNKYRYSGVAIEDLVQVGSVGLVKAIDKFDPERGTEFLAFAIPVIMGEIKNYFRDHGWAVKVPRKLQRLKMVVEKTVERLSQSGGRPPTVPEIAQDSGYTEEEVYDTFEMRRYGSPVSLEREYEQSGNGDSSSVLDCLGSEDPEFEALAEKIDLKKQIGILPDRERTIVILKFYSGLSQTEIAGRLGISQMHVSRLQGAALGKLKTSLEEIVG
jgi:RNA polymerase sigma-B factor